MIRTSASKNETAACDYIERMPAGSILRPSSPLRRIRVDRPVCSFGFSFSYMRGGWKCGSHCSRNVLKRFGYVLPPMWHLMRIVPDAVAAHQDKIRLGNHRFCGFDRGRDKGERRITSEAFEHSMCACVRACVCVYNGVTPPPPPQSHQHVSTSARQHISTSTRQHRH